MIFSWVVIPRGRQRGIQPRLRPHLDPGLRHAGVTAYLVLAASLAFAQGMMPKVSEEKNETPPAPYLLIGNSVPQSLTVIDSENKIRPLASFKAPTNLLVLIFLSTPCDKNSSFFHELNRYYDAYKDWHASFLGVSVDATDTIKELQDAITHEGLPIPIGRDEGRKVVEALHVTVTPEIVIIDEWGQLRYRGGIKESRRPLEAIVGQEPLVNPEPKVEGCVLP